MGHEIIPDVLDKPPKYPLEVTYKTIRTFPGMKLTADLTRFKPMLHWPADPNSIYTVVMSNLDINNRKNRYVFTYRVQNVNSPFLDPQIMLNFLSNLISTKVAIFSFQKGSEYNGNF